MELTAFTRPFADGWRALCPELDLAAVGGNAEAALTELGGIVKVFLRDATPTEIEERYVAGQHLLIPNE